MSATYQYTFKRWSLRGISDLMSVTAMPAMTTLAYERMASSAWLAATGVESDLPPHKYSQTGFLDTYDAAKYCGDYALGRQKAYACAACYSIKLPAEAQAGTKAKVEAIIASVYGDRWLAEGAILSAFLSASETPPAWATIVEAASPTYLASSPDPAPAVDAVTSPDWGAPLRRIARANVAPDHTYAATITADTATDATAYLHVVIRLSDYIAVPQLAVTGGGTRDSAWIEGGAKIDGTTLAVQFDRAVTADAQAKLPLRNEYSLALTPSPVAKFGNESIDAESAVHLLYFTGASAPEAMPGDAVMMRKLLAAREAQALRQVLVAATSTSTGNSVYPRFTTAGGYIGCIYKDNTGAAEPHHSFGLRGLFVVRETCTGGEVVDGLSFATAIPSLPVGQRVRIAIYAHDGVLPAASYSADFGSYERLNVLTMASACDSALIMGTATSASLANVSVGSAVTRDADLTIPPVSVSLVPLGIHDLSGGAGLAANTKIPFAAPYTLPRHVAICVAINVVGYTAEWVAAALTSTAVQYNPTGMYLHIV